MIENDEQYELTMYWAERFEQAAAHLAAEAERVASGQIPPGYVSLELRRIMALAARSEASVLRDELAEYDSKRGKPST